MENFNIVILPAAANAYTACEGYQALSASAAAEDFLGDAGAGGSVYAAPCDADCECDDYCSCDVCGAVLRS